MAHKDIPSRADIDLLANVRQPNCVSIYTPSGPLPEDGERARIELKNQLRDVVSQFEAANADKSVVEHVKDTVDTLLQDTMFWQYQANSLAIFITGDSFETYRLPNRFTATVDIADRFYIKPLLRTITFPQSAYVLALAQNNVRLVKVTADTPARDVSPKDMPTDIQTYLNLDLTGRATFGKGSEDGDLRAQQFTAAINKAILPVLRAERLPLILASAETLASAYRRTNSYKFLVEESISGNPEALNAEQLAEKTRPILDDLYAEEIEQVRQDFQAKTAQGLGSTDLAHVARAAVYDAIDSLMVDIDQRIPGYIDEDTAQIVESTTDDTSNYGVGDEVLRRTLIVNGKVYAVRADDMP
ncbi:MAG TPA: hypothetical protein VK054_02295, partial [Beutenbergiaceae bacterium]|nr:hypothetical protein [Beutenbergiaceae bacterium]